jgi:hypothetical protein
VNNKVFVPNEGAGHDYSDAERYGELVFVTGGSINPFDTGVMNRAWSSALADSSPSDYLVVTSLIKHKRLNLLLFSSRGKYRKREIVF